MCTLIILRRPNHPWPLIIAANRDEMEARPWATPARHWPDRAYVTAGLDNQAGGSWLGVNDYGLMAAILNRPGTLGAEDGKRSRGELVLEALDHAESCEAAKALVELNGAAYRPFNLVVADRREGFWLRLLKEGGQITATPLPDGLSMLTAFDLNDTTSPRIRHFKPLFEAAHVPDPQNDDWRAWQELLSQTHGAPASGPEGAMCIVDMQDSNHHGFGTRSSSLIALGQGAKGPETRWQFSPGPPGSTAWRAIET